MRRTQSVDLNSHINMDRLRGNPAEFEVSLEPVYHFTEGTKTPIPTRRAIVRQDTGEAIAVVSERYTLVPHVRILDVVEEAINPLDLGPVPRGIYVDRKGARMRALYKFPSLADTVVGTDEICPCIQVRNTYDGSERISMQIGAFRFVCTNLAMGGGGAFASGFVSIHAGEIPVEEMAGRLSDYLTRFDAIASLYRTWAEMPIETERLTCLLAEVLADRHPGLKDTMMLMPPPTMFAAYNQLTDYATHRMGSPRLAFEMLDRVNRVWQTASEQRN